MLVITYIRPLIKGQQSFWSVLETVNGGLAGMVAACAGCNNMHRNSLTKTSKKLFYFSYCKHYISWAAFVMGIMAGFNYVFYSWLLIQVRIDDLLGAFPG